ncbi:MAG TPA: cell division protein FtsZ [Candidatus Krumholzibacteria bacterium]|nr:cell division protein FtsZ [Candidatus Krumholzibacteria bacterium]
MASIRVAGVGGAGGNAVNRMIEAGLEGVDFFAINTDLQALRQSKAGQVIQIGHQVTRGLGSGGDPRVGRESVLEDEDVLRELLEGSDMVFVTAGMGGGTGTGAAPVVARVARELGALTVGVVTKPFRFEGRVRQNQAEAGLAELREAVDTLIVIPNERLLEVMPKKATMSDAFVYADNVLYEATRGIHDIIMKPHVVNLDFADVRSVMQDKGVALMGTGKAEGEDRAETAARAAISSPLLENVDIRGAEGVLVNISGAEIGLMETSAVMDIVQEAAGDEAHIIFGYGIEPELGETLQVTVIATGFDRTQRPRRAADAALGAMEAPVTAVPVTAVPAMAPVAAPAPVAEPEPVQPAALAPEIPETPAEAPAQVSATVPDVPAEDLTTGEDAPPVAAPRPQLRVMAAAAGSERPVVRMAPAAPPASETAVRFTAVETDPDPALRPAPASPAGNVTEDLPDSTFLGEDGGAEDAHPATHGTVGSWRPDPNRRSPFASDGLNRDLSEPAYTRKYMD